MGPQVLVQLDEEFEQKGCVRSPEKRIQCVWVPRVGFIVLGPVCACRLLPFLGIFCQSFTRNHQLHCNWVRSLQRPQLHLALLHNGKNVILQFWVTLCVCSWTLLTMGLRKDTLGVSPETKQSNRHNTGLRNAAFLNWSIIYEACVESLALLEPTASYHLAFAKTLWAKKTQKVWDLSYSQPQWQVKMGIWGGN